MIFDPSAGLGDEDPSPVPRRPQPSGENDGRALMRMRRSTADPRRRSSSFAADTQAETEREILFVLLQRLRLDAYKKEKDTPLRMSVKELKLVQQVLNRYCESEDQPQNSLTSTSGSGVRPRSSTFRCGNLELDRKDMKSLLQCCTQVTSMVVYEPTALQRPSSSASVTLQSPNAYSFVVGRPRQLQFAAFPILLCLTLEDVNVEMIDDVSSVARLTLRRTMIQDHLLKFRTLRHLECDAGAIEMPNLASVCYSLRSLTIAVDEIPGPLLVPQSGQAAGVGGHSRLPSASRKENADIFAANVICSPPFLFSWTPVRQYLRLFEHLLHGVAYWEGLTHITFKGSRRVSKHAVVAPLLRMDSSWQYLINLRVLSLTNLRLGSLNGFEPLAHCQYLRFLDLSDNVLTDLSDAVPSLPVSLVTLDLQCNCISTGFEGLTKLDALETLNLHSNEIVSWRELQPISQLVKLRSLTFTHNPVATDAFTFFHDDKETVAFVTQVLWGDLHQCPLKEVNGVLVTPSIVALATNDFKTKSSQLLYKQKTGKTRASREPTAKTFDSTLSPASGQLPEETSPLETEAVAEKKEKLRLTRRRQSERPKREIGDAIVYVAPPEATIEAAAELGRAERPHPHPGMTIDDLKERYGDCFLAHLPVPPPPPQVNADIPKEDNPSVPTRKESETSVREGEDVIILEAKMREEEKRRKNQKRTRATQAPIPVFERFLTVLRSNDWTYNVADLINERSPIGGLLQKPMKRGESVPKNENRTLIGFASGLFTDLSLLTDENAAVWEVVPPSARVLGTHRSEEDLPLGPVTLSTVDRLSHKVETLVFAHPTALEVCLRDVRSGGAAEDGRRFEGQSLIRVVEQAAGHTRYVRVEVKSSPTARFTDERRSICTVVMKTSTGTSVLDLPTSTVHIADSTEKNFDNSSVDVNAVFRAVHQRTPANLLAAFVVPQGPLTCLFLRQLQAQLQACHAKLCTNGIFREWPLHLDSGLASSLASLERDLSIPVNGAKQHLFDRLQQANTVSIDQQMDSGSSLRAATAELSRQRLGCNSVIPPDNELALVLSTFVFHEPSSNFFCVTFVNVAFADATTLLDTAKGGLEAVRGLTAQLSSLPLPPGKLFSEKSAVLVVTQQNLFLATDRNYPAAHSIVPVDSEDTFIGPERHPWTDLKAVKLTFDLQSFALRFPEGTFYCHTRDVGVTVAILKAILRVGVISMDQFQALPNRRVTTDPQPQKTPAKYADVAVAQCPFRSLTSAPLIFSVNLWFKSRNINKRISSVAVAQLFPLRHLQMWTPERSPSRPGTHSATASVEMGHGIKPSFHPGLQFCAASLVTTSTEIFLVDVIDPFEEDPRLGNTNVASPTGFGKGTGGVTVLHRAKLADVQAVELPHHSLFPLIVSIRFALRRSDVLTATKSSSGQTKDDNEESVAPASLNNSPAATKSASFGEVDEVCHRWVLCAPHPNTVGLLVTELKRCRQDLPIEELNVPTYMSHEGL